MKRTVMLLATAAAGLFGLGVVAETTTGGSPVVADDVVERVCQPQDQHQKPSETTDSLTVSAPEGFLITGYCVKAGSVTTGDGPEFTPVTPPAASVTISHTSEKDISHYVLYLTRITPPPPDVPALPDEPVFDPPTCDAPGRFVAPASTEALEYSTTTENGVITITVVAKPGFVISGNPGPWTKDVAALAQLSGDRCDGTQPPDEPEVDAAGPVPSTTPPGQAVATSGPPAQAAPPVDPAPASLPTTGSSSWALAGAALAALGAGLFLTRLSRRTDEQVV